MVENLFAPVLWGQPNAASYVLQRLWVMGPYPTAEFFRHFLAHFQPKSVLLVADDAWSREEVDRIHDLIRDRSSDVPFHARYASCQGPGQFHAKVYMAEWLTDWWTPTPVYVRRLLWGSANASLSGFGRNAEALACVSLEDAGNSALIDYFEQLWGQRSGKVPQVDASFQGSLRLLLPSFEFSSDTREPESFEAWVQSGRLCHKYERDSSFAKLSITLKRALPAGTLARLFTTAELRPDTNSKTFRYPYLSEIAHRESRKALQWRARYFLETWLGFWTSDACYRECRVTFKGDNEASRRGILERIKGSDSAEHRQWIDSFIERLRKVVAGLKENGRDPRNYFSLKGNDLDVSHYTDSATEQLNRQRLRAHDPVFEERFTAGYAFKPVPHFRGIEAAEEGSFSSFIESLCESILSRLRGKKQNLLVIRIGKELEKLRIQPTTARDLHEELDRNWHRIGDAVRGFYKRRRTT